MPLTRPRQQPRIALVTTMLNEPRLVRQHMQYFRWLGIDHVYIYDDGCTDDTFERVADLPYVQIMQPVDPQQFAGRPEIAGAVKNYATHLPARQQVNISHAIETARREGFDWLVSLDVDELICLDRRCQVQNHLKRFLGGVNPLFEQVIFVPLEMVQTKAETGCVFAEATLFLQPWLRIPRAIFDPYQQQDFLLRSQFLGHRWGKPAMRLSADLYPYSVHRFTRRTGIFTAPTRLAGDLLHYNAYDWRDFIKKFRAIRKEPNHWYSGKVMGYEKQLWRNLANDPQLSEEDLREYFERSIVYKPEQLADLQRRRWLCKAPGMRPLVEVTSVCRAFKEHQWQCAPKTRQSEAA